MRARQAQAHPCFGVRFLRPILTAAIAAARWSGVNFDQRSDASFEAAGFGLTRFLGRPQRARAALRISAVRSSAGTSSHRFLPPKTCGFSGATDRRRKHRV
jgi:hypothetical protein